MPKLVSFLIRLVVTIFIALFILALCRDFIIKCAVEIASPKVLGAKVEIGTLSLEIFAHKVHIKNLRIYNPPGFPDQVFLVAPEVSVNVDTASLMKGKIYCPLVVFNMDRMVIVKNKDGKLNVDSLKIIEEQKAANKGKPAKLPVFKIDILELNVGKVILEDYTHAPPVRVEAYNVGIKDQKIRNINGLPKLVTSIVVETIKPTAIRSAGLIAAEAFLGVGFLPALAIGVAIAQDSVNADLNDSFDKVYREVLGLVKDQDMGTVKKEDRAKGQILARVYKCDITINVQDKGWNKSHVIIKVRQYMLAKLEIANGLLYQLMERLK